MIERQQEFEELLADLDCIADERVWAHRSAVQAWFDGLTATQKNLLGEWLEGASDYLTFQALQAAAGTHHRSRPHHKQALGAVHGMEEAVVVCDHHASKGVRP